MAICIQITIAAATAAISVIRESVYYGNNISVLAGENTVLHAVVGEAGGEGLSGIYLLLYIIAVEILANFI